MAQGMNPQKMMKQMQKMQADMARVQQELAAETVSASAGGGAVTAVVSGGLELMEVTIDPAAVDPEDVELLQDMVLAAVNEAMRQADDLREKAMSASAGFDPMEALGALGLGGAGGGLGGGGGGLPGGMPGGAPNRAARRKKK